MSSIHTAATAPMRWAAVCAAVAIVAGLIPLPADAQIHVAPQRPTQSNVQYFDFNWHHKDIEIGPGANTSDARLFRIDTLRDQLSSAFPRLFADSQGADDHYYPMRRPRRHGIPDFQPSVFAGTFHDFPDPTEDTRTEPPPPTLQDPDEEDDEDADEEEYQPVLDPTDLDDKSGGVRLYFYERERRIAERAAAFIQESYRELVDIFEFVPSRTLPYILYSSYQEFLQTNVFPVQEGVLGVTGRADLQLVLPYFGDHRMFQHISTHEMVHQFQIQKAREVADAAGVSGDPLDQMPLWFIEGMAEYYSLGGLDAETEMLARDLLVNPDVGAGYAMLDFFADRPRSQLWTYKLGQARVAFLEETYGEGTIQEIFNRSYQLVGARGERRQTRTFRSLLVDITGDDRRRMSDRFEDWLKRRSYTDYLDSGQGSADLQFFDEPRGIVQTIASSPDGQLVAYRSIQRSTGQVRLFVADARDQTSHRRIASDGRPGIESLHPIGPRTFDVHGDQVAFFARAEGRDLLYIQQLDHEVEQDDNGEWDVRLRRGSRVAYDLGEQDLLAAETPAFSPDGRRLAFIGLDDDGQKDVYLFQPLEDGDYTLTRLTDDAHAQRGLSWGDGRIVFTSDATGHGYYNLFGVDLHTGPGEPQRLTFEERDQFDPHITDEGRVLFSMYNESRANLYEWTADEVLLHSDVATGLFDVTDGPGDSLWTSFHHRGQRRIARFDNDLLLDESTDPEPEDEQEASPYPRLSLDTADRYSAVDFRNWRISNVFGVLGASTTGIFGQLMLLTNDRLRNHALFVNVLAFGDLDNTVADIMYLNQQQRLIWGTGLFQDVRYRIDRTLETDVDETVDDEFTRRFLSGERFYGGRVTLRYPFNRFMFVQGELAVGGVTFFLPGFTEQRLRDLQQDHDANFIGPWEHTHDEHRFQTSPTVSLGYNTVRYHPGTGPIDGSSALLSGTLDVQPLQPEVHGKLRLDAERYFPIYDRINLSLRGGVGSTFGGELARQFFLSSFDTLRGVEYGDVDYLLGNQFFFTKLELRFPLNFLVRIPFIDVEGVVGADFGGAGQDLADLWRWRAFSPVAGLNFGLGPLVFRLHFARPIDIGAPRLPRDGNWITNFSLGWRYW